MACPAQIAHRHGRFTLGACISPKGLSCCLGVCGALPSPRYQSIAWCSPFGLSGGKGTLGSTVCTQASLCGCIRPKRANRFMLHIAAYVVHCQLLVSNATWCSLFSFSGVKGAHRCMACPEHIAQGIAVCVHYTQRLELLPRIQHVHYHSVCDTLPVPRQQRIAWCSLFPLQVARGHVDGCPGIAVRMH